MSVDASKLVIPGHGTVFTAPKNTLPPTNPLAAFTLTNQPGSWVNLGHTSKANTIAFTKEGGEKESIDTFLADAVRYTTAAISWGVTVPALQFDADNLKLAFNGKWDPVTGGYIVATSEPVEAALFLFFQDTSGALGFWIPNTVVSLGDAPSVDPTAFFELPLAASIQSADAGIIPTVGGRVGVFEIFKTGLAPQHATWTYAITGTPTGGTYKLVINGVETGTIAYNANASTIAAAINAVSGITGVTVTGTGPFTVVFPAMANLDVNITGLTGGTPGKTVTAVS